MSVENFVTDSTKYWTEYSFPPGTSNVIAGFPLRRKNGPLAVIMQEAVADIGDGSGVTEPREIPHGVATLESEANALSRALVSTYDSPSGKLSDAFTIHSPSPDHGLLCRVEPEGQGHTVYSSDGVILARITRRPARFLPWPRRLQWSLEVMRTEGNRLYVGRKGTMRAWVAFFLFSPVWGALALLGILATIMGERDPWLLWGMPSRTKWRASMFQWGLDFRGVSSTFRIDPEKFDARVAYAQAIIHRWVRELE